MRVLARFLLLAAFAPASVAQPLRNSFAEDPVENRIVDAAERTQGDDDRLRPVPAGKVRITDPFWNKRLASLRQRILTGMNTLLKTTLVEEIVFSHFRAVHVPISQYSLLRRPLSTNTFQELATVTNVPGNIRKELTGQKENGPEYQNSGPQWNSSLGLTALVTERNFCLYQPSFWSRRRLHPDNCKGSVG